MSILVSVILGMFGPWEIVIIVLVIVLIFGGRKIPELMRGLGQGMKEFKNATKEEKDTNENQDTEKK
jgi:sec-independent protein translocase protein TatA